MHGGTRHIFTCVCKTQCASVQSVATLRHWQEEHVCRYFCRQLHGKITIISLRRTATVSIGLPTEVDSKAIVITQPHRIHASHTPWGRKKEPLSFVNKSFNTQCIVTKFSTLMLMNIIIDVIYLVYGIYTNFRRLLCKKCDVGYYVINRSVMKLTITGQCL